MSQNEMPSNPLGKQFYLPELDGLRFFAFFIVFLHHTLLNISSTNPFLNAFLVTIQKNGWVGVDLFFVLSGFLISLLLLKERENYGRFSLKKFWIRRSLRIWPLYYLALLMGFFVVPYISANFFNTDYSDPKFMIQIKEQLILYLAFLGNWAVSFNGYGYYTTISHLWTISLEEQFYFFWPPVLLFIKSLKKGVIVIVGLIILALLSRTYLVFQGVEHPGVYTNTLARIDTLTLGALLAIIYFYRPTIFTKIKHLFSLPIIMGISVLFFLFLYRFYFLSPEQPLQVIFGYLIIAIFMGYFLLSSIVGSAQFRSLLRLRPLVWMGKISYGLYVWHMLAIQISHQLNLNILLLHVVLSFIFTLLIAAISYYLFEIQFLKMKNKFSQIQSRPL